MSQNQKDVTGVIYSTPDNKPAPSGVHITIHTPTGPVQGTMVGQHAVPNNTTK
jgi:hypothetical protein